eukprot:1340071-Rhodomonas_salina.1
MPRSSQPCSRISCVPVHVLTERVALYQKALLKILAEVSAPPHETYCRPVTNSPLCDLLSSSNLPSTVL